MSGPSTELLQALVGDKEHQYINGQKEPPTGITLQPRNLMGCWRNSQDGKEMREEAALGYGDGSIDKVLTT